MLVPLTSSLHVRGALTTPGRVLLDIGTGYYVEARGDAGRMWMCGTAARRWGPGGMVRRGGRPPSSHPPLPPRPPISLFLPQTTSERGAEYCRRKIEFVRERLDEIGEAREGD